MDWRKSIGCLLLSMSAGVLHAQSQVTVAAPLWASHDRFFSNVAMTFGYRRVSPNGIVVFRNGGFGTGPVFGGFDPAAQSFFGVGGRKGNASWNLGLSFGQGYSQSSVSTTPSLTMANGGFGFINSSIQRPFVTGFIPVVGSRRVSPLEERLARLRFHRAVKDAKVKRDQNEAEALRHAGPASGSSRHTKPDDPPLILGKAR